MIHSQSWSCPALLAAEIHVELPRLSSNRHAPDQIRNTRIHREIWISAARNWFPHGQRHRRQNKKQRNDFIFSLHVKCQKDNLIGANHVRQP